MSREELIAAWEKLCARQHTPHYVIDEGRQVINATDECDLPQLSLWRLMLQVGY